MKAILLFLSVGYLIGADRQVPMTVETPTVSLTISTKRVGKYAVGATESFCAIYVRIAAKTEAPIDFDPTKFFMKTADGKALPWMNPEAVERMMVGKTGVLTAAIVGTQMREPVQQGYAVRLHELMLEPGTIPANSFREGVVYFKGSGSKKDKPVLLSLTGLSDEPVSLRW